MEVRKIRKIIGEVSLPVMMNPGMVDLRLTDIWNTKIPLKIKILWMVWNPDGRATKEKKVGGDRSNVNYVLKKRTLITFCSDVRWQFLSGVGCAIALGGSISLLVLRIFRQAS